MSDITIDWLASYGVDIVVARAYAESLWSHIAHVREAGIKLGVPMRLLDVHDHSKWDADEFPAYARHFKGGGDPAGFARAWLRHMHLNPHHWEHWIFPPNGFIPPGADVIGGALPMPHDYALEMIADWQGASLAYTGSDDMAEWLTRNLPRLRLHPETAEFLRVTLDGLGYGEIVYTARFAHEVEY